jgi:predicted RNA-binding Zn-ribbon protein involved in translation (DUF1610 family)
MAKPIFIEYKCPKCGYKKVFYFGDTLTPIDFIKKCPRCGALMDRGENIRDFNKGILHNIFNR